MRKICTGDVFKAARLLKQCDAMGILRKAYAAGKAEGADKGKVGMDLAVDIMCSCTDPAVEGQFYELLSGICEKTPEDVKNQSLDAMEEDIRRICMENNVLNFLKSALGLGETMTG